MSKRRYALFIIAAAAAAVLGVLAATALVDSAPERPVIEATYLPDGKAIAEFRLVDHRGQPVSEEDLKGRWSLLFFGYTSCPDVCPMTLHILNQAYRQIEAAGGEAPRVTLVSVDPQRDTPERLAQYLAYFHPDFVGMTGEPAQLDALARSLGAAYAVHGDPDGDGQYPVDHSGIVFFVNPAGRLQAVATGPHEPEQIAHDFLALRDTWTER